MQILCKDCVNIYPHCVQVNIYTIFMCMGKYCVNIYPYSSVGGRNRFLMSIFCRKLCILKHLRCFVAIYAYFCVKLLPQKFRSCNFFDKYHVCNTVTNTLWKYKLMVMLCYPLKVLLCSYLVYLCLYLVYLCLYVSVFV